MAWNEVQFKGDGIVHFQAYYARLNALRQFMSPLTLQLFEAAWNVPNEDGFQILRRTMLVGELVADVVRSFGIDDTAFVRPQVGEWFVHSGDTIYKQMEGHQVASIMLPDDVILSDV